MSNLKNKVALITGAGGEHGIGRAIALRFAREGADIAICDINTNARGDWAGLPAVAEEIEAMGRKVLATEVDVTSAEQVQQMVNTALARALAKSTSSSTTRVPPPDRTAYPLPN